MRSGFIVLMFMLATTLVHAQMAADSTRKADSLSARKVFLEDSMTKAFTAMAMYPLIKASLWSGVIPVSAIDEKPNTVQRYKLMMEVTEGIKDSVEAKEINGSLAEIGRLINIHLAAGIPKQNLDIVVVAHGGILKSFYTNDMYRKKYKTANPNLALLNELQAAGVKFIACGQAMAYQKIEKPDLLPLMRVALSAQSALTDYELRGYVHKVINKE